MGERPSTELVIDGRVVVVRVRESRRARTMRLTVGPGRPPEVVVPARTGHRAVDTFIRAKQQWLAGKLAAPSPPRELCVERPGTVWLSGQPVPVIYRSTDRPAAALLDGRLVVGGTPTDAVARIDRWYRAEARRELHATADHEADRMGVRYQAISVRDQRTRWGSCSRSGRLSFSWRLVMAPREVLEYVVLHELCHLREFNHSRSFWRLLESLRPHGRESATWLRQHGHELHEFVPANVIKVETRVRAEAADRVWIGSQSEGLTCSAPVITSR
jgi:predicted metal-dependent hydrolase